MNRKLSIEPAQVRSALTLQFTGELTGETAAATVAAVDRAAAGLWAGSVLVLDLRELELLAAAGIRSLMVAADRYAARGVRCGVVVHPGSGVAAALSAAQTQAVLPQFADVEQAFTEVVADPEDLSGQFERLTRALLGTRTVGAALQHVVDATTVAIPTAAAVSVTLRAPDGRVFTPVQTAGVAADLDRVQYRTGEGPCLDAADPAGPAYAGSRDLATEPRWPAFAAAATAAGYRAVHSTEVLPGSGPGRLTGALNIYFPDNHSVDETGRSTALLLATHAALALAHARSTELADLHDIQMHEAIDTRDVIGQAKGILMHRQGITADQAFGLLRDTSQDLNVKLVELARNLVAHHDELDR